MKAQVGDRIMLAGTRVDDPVRDGEVLEVKGIDGGAPYMVRWSDGHTGLVYPGPGAVMRVESDSDVPGRSEETIRTAQRSKTWRVQVSVARALRHLTDSLLARAESDISASTGTSAYVRPL